MTGYVSWSKAKVEGAWDGGLLGLVALMTPTRFECRVKGAWDGGSWVPALVSDGGSRLVPG
jgi:hypothetical protein